MKGWIVFLIAGICLLIGGMIGGVLALGYGSGLGAATGLVVGSQAGVCMAVTSARDAGMLSPDQADALIADAVRKIREGTSLAEEEDMKWMSSESDCAGMMERINEGER